ncbi:sensor histidine kinase [Tenacibaculum amylolyticum]|uniref:sensor histidine kinase n=1 Tax=Tenacibaculum amylolyticum TaxID=104269 RepID=UPI003895A870
MNLIFNTIEQKNEKWYKRFKIGFHVVYFAGFIAIMSFGYNYSLDDLFNKKVFGRDVFEGSIITLLTYLFYYLIYRSDRLFLSKLKWALLGVFVLGIMAYNKEVGGKTFVIMYSDNSVFKEVPPNNIIFSTLENLVLYIGLSTILFSFLWLLDKPYLIFNTRFWSMKKALEEAESKLLRQQFNPHFLYNAFNSLYSMSLKNNPKTPDTILKLSRMMRFLTDDTAKSNIKLTQEFTFIKEYIEIEKIRFGEQANIRFEVTGDASTIQIEPLLLITLVENAFKHGFYTNDAKAFVFINATIKDKELSFSVENSIQKKQHFQISEREGTGLENLKKRLKLLYPKTSSLKVTEKNDVFLAELKINVL